MSAHVQKDPGRVVVIADELESIFHVLIFYGIRFLHHNLFDGEVGQYLRDYFDGASTSTLGVSYGLTKHNAVSQGAINIENYRRNPGSMASTLQFIWPAAEDPGCRPKGHPLNHLIKSLLSWFMAHYVFDRDLMSELDATDTDLDDSTDGAEVPIENSEDEDGFSEDEDETCPSLLDMPESLARLSSKLHSHHAFINLFGRSLRHRWPTQDKTVDKRPKDGFAPKQDEPVCSDSELTKPTCVWVVEGPGLDAEAGTDEEDQ